MSRYWYGRLFAGTSPTYLTHGNWLCGPGGRHRAPGTVKAYTTGATAFMGWCESTGTPLALTKASVQAFIAALLDDGAEPATATSRLTGLKRFTAWLVEEGSYAYRSGRVRVAVNCESIGRVVKMGSRPALSPGQAGLEPYSFAALFTALSNARRHGCCIAEGSIRELATVLTAGGDSDISRRTGVKIVLSRPKDPPVQVLTPLDPSEAAPRSLSAKFGKGALPFHTDGSHLDHPPRFVLLDAEHPSEDHAPTQLLRLSPDADIAQDMRHGVFSVDTGTSAFYTTCRSGEGSAIRFDLGCMSPIDPRSRRLTQKILNADPDYVHHWSSDSRVLIIDNTQVLHGRAHADAPTNRSLLRLMLTDMEREW